MSHKKRKHNPKNVQKTDSAEKRAAKKAEVLGTEKHSPLPMMIILGSILLVVGGAMAYKFNTGKNNTAAVAEVPAIVQSASTQTTDQIKHPASLFIGGQAQHFQYIADNITIKYFILKSSDGVIRAAFDACDVCWPAGKGYYQEGDHMVCRNCGRKFVSILVNEVQGGCNPAPLKRRIQDDQVVIEVKDLLEGAGYFDFSQNT